MSNEVKKCKRCGNFKSHIYDGLFPNGKDKKYRDESNTLWSGTVCGSCNNIRLKNIMKRARKNKNVAPKIGS